MLQLANRPTGRWFSGLVQCQDRMTTRSRSIDAAQAKRLAEFFHVPVDFFV
jgi:hypothetical protein